MRRAVMILCVALVLGCAHGGPQPGPVAPAAEQDEEREATQAEKERGSKAAWFVLDAVETIIWIAK